MTSPAIRQIERQPHHQLVTTHVKTRGDQLGRLDQQGRNYLRKRPHLFCEVHDGIKIQHRSLMPVSGLKAKKELTYDTLENRFVKWMMTRLIDKLQDLWEKVQSKNKRYEVEADPDLLTKIMNMKRALEAKTNNWFWRSIGKLDRSIMSLVLQMAPGYRDAYQIFLIVTRGLALQGKLYQMSVKDVATLYEYWTFLKLGQLLGKKYKLVSQDIIQVNRSGLFVNLEKNRSAKRVYEHPHTGEKIILTYQKYEGRLPTIPQIPDTMLSIEKKGKDYTFNYIFDAKYRIDFAVEEAATKNAITFLARWKKTSTQCIVTAIRLLSATTDLMKEPLLAPMCYFLGTMRIVIKSTSCTKALMKSISAVCRFCQTRPG